jgi:hypothetical protein
LVLLAAKATSAKESKREPVAEVVQEEQMVEDNKENEEPNIPAQSESEVVNEMDADDLVVSYSFDKLIEEDEAEKQMPL